MSASASSSTSSSASTSANGGKIGLGLCCINTVLQKKKIICSKTMIQKNFTVDKAKTLALCNVKNIKPLLQWNDENGIKNLRISSDIFPHFTNPNVEKYSMDFAKEVFADVAQYAHANGHRLYTHPGQYNQIGAKSADVFQKTVDDLDMHAQMLEYLGYDAPGGICIHGGGVYGDKEGTIRRWIEQFSDLPARVRRCVAIENCEKCYSTRDAITIAEACKIPVIFDCHHYECYKILHPDEKEEDLDVLLDEVVDTWKGNKPIFHISEQRKDGRIGAHSDFIETIPDYLLEIPKKYNIDFTLDVEAKMKEQAILKLYEKYPFLKC
jgi:UV DNA damage endonuclease